MSFPTLQCYNCGRPSLPHLLSHSEHGDRYRSSRTENHWLKSQFLIFWYHSTDFLFALKSGIISIQMKPAAEKAQHYHLTIDDYANSDNVHWCTQRKREQGEKLVIGAPSLHLQQWNSFSLLKRNICENLHWFTEILHSHMGGLWAAQ